jgi:hypothetical protein
MSEEGYIIYGSYIQWVRASPPDIEESKFWMSIEELKTE